MLRVRFHGRGGHGVKTASRILGTAAFLGGLEAQDSPVYGAERRGAPVTACTRIDAAPIDERGPVAAPDLVLVADETLFADPSAGVLRGCQGASGLFVNSPRDGAALASQYAIPCPVFTLDLTTRATEHLGRGSALSAALGAAACALAGFRPVGTVLRAVREELADLFLSSEIIEKNAEVARWTCAGLPAVALVDRSPASAGCPMHAPTYTAGPEGVPALYAPGNSPERHTGSWRLVRPVIDLGACTRCGICFALCPDGAITLDARAYPTIDYDNCKGCMICAQECPIECIRAEKEVRAW
jgi:pyruvate ferredoxin oxidoreductase gamma subunit